MALVTWVKCQSNIWCPFETVTLENIGNISGVYVIWHEGNPSQVVRVGQGIVIERIAAHRQDKVTTQYRQFGTLQITWAAVPKKADRDGIERFLANHYKPLVGDAWPDVAPIPVNLPGA